MSKMKALGMLFGAMMSSTKVANDSKFSETDLNKLKSFRNEKVKKMYLQKGVREFTIDGITVMARSEENAIRKVNKIKNK